MDTFTIILKRFGGIIESVRDDEPIRASNLLPCEITLEVTLVQLPLLPFSVRRHGKIRNYDSIATGYNPRESGVGTISCR